MKSKKIQDISSNKYWDEWKLEIVEIQHIRIYIIHIDISSCLYIVQGGLGGSVYILLKMIYDGIFLNTLS